jgi:hypothetical protein
MSMIALRGMLSKKIIALTLCCCAFTTRYSFAEIVMPQSAQVNESETQLAKRLAVRESAESRFEYTLSAAYRQDNLSWSIADVGANFASEVQWKNTAVMQLRADAKLHFNYDWQMRGYLTTGAVRSGENQDSDYAGNNRTVEISRSNNKSGGAVRDFSIALGKKIQLPDFKIKAATYSLHIVPMVGLSVHQQSFTMFDGHQTLPVNNAFANLNNHYDNKWQGAWLGVDGLLNVSDKFTFNATGEYHWADYSVDANWNLRNDLAHPVSFTHHATGQGIVTKVGGTYRVNRNFLMNVALDYQTWQTSGGYDQTHFASGAVSYYPLNPVRWDSTSLALGAVYQF